MHVYFNVLYIINFFHVPIFLYLIQKRVKGEGIFSAPLSGRTFSLGVILMPIPFELQEETFH